MIASSYFGYFSQYLSSV